MNRKIKLKSLIIALISIGLLLVLTNKSEASSTSISANAREVNLGETVTITGSVNAGAWNLTLSGAGQSKGLVGQTSTTDNASASVSLSFTPTTAGQYTFTLAGDITDYYTDISEPVSKPITVTAVATNTGNNGATDNNNNSNTSDNKESNNNTANKKSSEARLSNVWFEPKKYDFSGFRKNTTSYDLTVPYEAEEITVKATATHKNAKVDGTGKVKLKEGTNTITLKVTAEDGKTTKTYTFKVTRTAKKEEPKEENTDNNEETNNNAQEGQQGETSNETINGLGLTSLSIKDHSLSPKFDAKTYEYTVGIKEDISSLDIQTKTNTENATVEIIGNENLQQGENIITILVSDSETQEVATYQIIVNKNVTAQEVVGKVEWLKPSTWGLKEKLIVGAVIVLVLVIVVVVIIKIRLSRIDNDDFDLPGADELDRALTEHQELTYDEFSTNDKNNDGVNDFFSTPTSESTVSEKEEDASSNKVEEESVSNEEEQTSKLRRSEIPEDFFEKPSYSFSSRKKGKHF